MRKFDTVSWDKIEKMNRTKGEMIKIFFLDGDLKIRSYDTALQQDWLNELVKKSGLDYQKALFSTCTLYFENESSGVQYSFWDECQRAINTFYRKEEILDNIADKYASEITHELLDTFSGGIPADKMVSELSQGISKTFVTELLYKGKENE